MFVDAVETGLVTGGERNGARPVDQAAEGEGHPIAGVFRVLGFGQLALHFTIYERGFDHTESLHAPAAGDHLIHQTLLDRAAGLISRGVIPEHFLELIWIFACKEDSFFRGESMIERILR